ncbi:MAG: hypothetical protein KBD37_07450, partial [Burkholderiales bacterium]|nr:hypothetical protein [Burkholderiales bacterium]
MKQIDIHNVWSVIKADKKIIAFISGVAVFFAVIYCLLATPIYMASVVINPPKISDSGSGLNNFAYGLSAMGGFYQKSDADIAMAMLKTRIVADQIINHFNLVKYYKAKNIVEARKELATATTYNA